MGKWERGPILLSIAYWPAAGDRPATRYDEVSGYVWGAWGIDRRDGRWCVNHRPTGHFVASFDRLADAKRFAETVDPLANWRRLRSARSRVLKRLAPTVRAIDEAIRHGEEAPAHA